MTSASSAGSFPHCSSTPGVPCTPATSPSIRGTTDLDIGLALGLLDDSRYTEITARLRAEGFQPDVNAAGNTTVQRWRLGRLPVTVDFLIPPPPGHDEAARVRNLEGDFGALVTPGLQLAFDERVHVELNGYTVGGESVSRTVPVCGPGAYVVLKALAFGDRAEPKDAYDLVYVVRHTPGGGAAIADRLCGHGRGHGAIVRRALMVLQRDFGGLDSPGPRRAARFILPESAADDAFDDAAADAHGHVDDLIVACRDLGLLDLGHGHASA